MQSSMPLIALTDLTGCAETVMYYSHRCWGERQAGERGMLGVRSRILLAKVGLFFPTFLPPPSPPPISNHTAHVLLKNDAEWEAQL